MTMKVGKADEEEEYVRMCPKCGSTDINNRIQCPGRSIQDNFTCNVCGYSSIAVMPEFRKKDIEKIRAQMTGREEGAGRN